MTVVVSARNGSCSSRLRLERTSVLPALQAPTPRPLPLQGEGRLAKGARSPCPYRRFPLISFPFGNQPQPPPFSRIGGKEGIGGEQSRLTPRIGSRTVKPAVSATPPQPSPYRGREG